MAIILCCLAGLSAAFLAGVGPFLGPPLLAVCPAAFAVIIGIPLAAAVNSGVLLWLFLSRRVLGRLAVAAFLLLLAATVLLVLAMIGNMDDALQLAFADREGLEVSLYPALLLAAGLFCAARLAGPGRTGLRGLAAELVLLRPADASASVRMAAAGLLSAAFSIAALLAFGPDRGPTLNRHGLVSFPAGATTVEDYSGNDEVDGYPPAVNRYNSLGYRDREPAVLEPGCRRVLVVGDSFVWGLGIPDNEHTLPALLAGALERRAPGRFDVAAAGFPGNGLYGYGRAVKALVPELDVDIVILSYIGGNDHDPLDSQAIMDRSPESPLLRAVVDGLRVRQFVHACSRRVLGRPGWADTGRTLAQAQRQVDELGDFGRRLGVRLVLLRGYFREVPRLRLSSGIEAFDLPEELAYPDSRNRYWYGKDAHPRPALNEAVAELLADRLVKAGPGPEG
ncbi:MAG: SGNH/GDSL hydrolase family protein [Elusimicrobiota bacterium]|jgi:hypothetical protein